MALTASHKNPINLLRDFRVKAQERTNITNYDRTSKFRALSDVLTSEAVALREEWVATDYATQIKTARGADLDRIGDRYGMSRIRSTHATVSSSERSLAFYVESGTFGDINNGSDIIIPSVIVSSEPNSNELNTTVDYNANAITLSSGTSIKYISAQALNSGSNSNVGRSVLRVHDFTGYADSANSSLKIINFYPIISGLNEESDDSFRSRIGNYYNRLITNNEIRLKLSGLEIPGIIDTRVVPGYYGIGSTAVFALGPEYQTNVQVLKNLQDRLNSYSSPGAALIATPATEVLFDFYIELQPLKTLSATQITRLRTEVNKGFLDYFGSLRIGGFVDLDLLLLSIQKRITTIASFKQIGGDRVFKRVYIRRRPASGLPEEQSRLATRSYPLDVYEFASLGILDIQVV